MAAVRLPPSRWRPQLVAVGSQVQFNDGGGDAGVTSGGVAVGRLGGDHGRLRLCRSRADRDAGVTSGGQHRGAGDEVFRISVDAAGNVTFEQSLVLDHTRARHQPRLHTTDILTLSDGQLSLTKETTVTDGDGDTATDSASVDLGGNFAIGDDGPKVTVTADGDEPDTVYLFDGNLIDGNFEGDNGTGLPTGDIASNGDPTQVTVDFSGNFTMPFMAGADGGSASSTFSLALNVAVGSQVQFNDGGGDAGVTSGGVAVDWAEITAGSVYAGVLTGTNTEVFRISVDAAGNVTFEQSLVLDHTRADTSPDYTTDILTLSDGQLSLTKETTVTDGDGDTATDSASVDLGGNFAIGDDGPKVTVTADGDEPDTVYLFDGNLIDGNFEGDNGTGLPTGDIASNGDPTQVTVDFSGNFTMPFMAGADGGSASSTFSLALNVAVGSQVQFNDGGGDAGVTSGGIVVVWSEVSAGEIYAGILDSGPNAGDEVFRISVDAVTGEVTFEQSLVLDHTRADTSPDYTTDILTLSDGQLSLTKETTVTDGDGDTATDSASVDLGGNFAIGDDGPEKIFTENAYLLNEANAMFVGDLDTDINIDDNVGADQLGTVVFDPALNSANSGLKSGGEDIFYTLIDSGQTLIAYTGVTVPTATTDSGVVFFVELQPDGSIGTSNDTYKVTMVGTVDGGESTIDFGDSNFEAFGSNADWNGFVSIDEGPLPGTPIDNSSEDLLITPVGLNTGTVNNNANEFGAGGGGGGQAIGSGEGLRLDFIIDLEGDPASGSGDYTTPANRDHTFDGHYAVLAASVGFALEPNKVASAEFKTFDDPDSDPGPSQTTVGDGSQTIITGIIIQHDGVDSSLITADGPYVVNGQTYIVDINADGTGSVIVNGLTDDDKVRVFGGPTGFESLEVLYVDGGADGDDPFGLKDFETSFIDPGDPVNLTLGLLLVDADGDTASASLDITLLPPDPATTVDLSGEGLGQTVTLAANELHAIGSLFDDNLTGNGEDNVIAGLDGNDTILGLAGMDILDGGKDNDTIDGGDDADIVIGGEGDDIQTGGLGADTFILTEFNVNDLIVDYSGSGSQGDVIDITELLVSAATLGTFNDFVQYDSTSRVLKVDADGGADGFVNAVTVESAPLTAATNILILFDDGEAPALLTNVV